MIFLLLLGVWRSQHWQSQRVAPITSYDVGGGSFLFFGASNGSIYYIDMEKFPLRMKDNDLLVRNYKFSCVFTENVKTNEKFNIFFCYVM